LTVYKAACIIKKLIEEKQFMKLKQKIDVRMVCREIYWILLILTLLAVIPVFRSTFSRPIYSGFITSAVTSLIGWFMDRRYIGIFLEKPYIYLNTYRRKVSPINDLPIRLPDITGYSLNNPFPVYQRWCKSSSNLTLYLLYGKQVTFSVKEQSMLVDWLKENYIRCIRKIDSRAVIEHIICTIINLFLIVFYIYQIKMDVQADASFNCLLISAACFAYWIIYMVSGIYIRENSQVSF
jgi:hypothetical protein